MLTTAVFVLFAIVVAQRLSELVLARRNYAAAIANGAIEHAAGHYPLFFILHIGWLLGWLVESLLRGPALSPVWWLWLVIFLAAEGLRYWCIITLGPRWNTRILVFPGAPLVATGPYRYIPHPNYLAVALELLSVPLIFNAWATALVATLFNAFILLVIRIPAEERALSTPEHTPQ